MDVRTSVAIENYATFMLPPDHPALRDEPPADADAQRPSPELLLWAYGHGIFPMVDPRRRVVEWFCPDPRAIFPLHPPEAFHVPKNLQRLVRKGVFDIRFDTEFEQVIRACATARSRTNLSWLNEQLIQSYIALHQNGHVHSVEAWRNDQLVGGLYGVQIGGAFFGESMFSIPQRGGSNSSKVCLVHLVQRLRHRGFTLLDTQFRNPHLEQFGCMEIPAAEYLARLHEALRLPVTWGQ